MNAFHSTEACKINLNKFKKNSPLLNSYYKN